MKSIQENLSLSIRARYPILYLVTWEEDRAEKLINEIGQSLNKTVVSWTVSKGFVPEQDPAINSAKPEEALKHIAKCPKNAIYLLKDFHPFLENEQVVRRMRDLTHALKRSRKTVILVSPALKIPVELEKEITVYDLPLPEPKELNTVLHALLEPFRNSTEVKIHLTPDLAEKVVQATLGLTLNEAENVYARALISNREFSESDLPDILEEKRQLIRKSGILDFIGFTTSMGNVGGLEELKKWLGVRGQAFSARAREYGLPEPKGLLMIGVQGCGKSLVAKAAACAWNLPLLRLDVGKIFGSFVGDSEQNMRRAIAVAESMSPNVLWLDEIEKGFAGAQGSGSLDSGVTARVFGTFITWMQEKSRPVFVIATANDISALPPELLRKGRFDDIFFVDLPKPAERMEIFRIHIRLKKRDPGKFDLAQLAKRSEHFSGAEIEQAVVSAMYAAFSENREFTTGDIMQAVVETVPLAVTAREKIAALREWAGQRARPASSAK